MVAINRIHWSPWAGARTLAILVFAGILVARLASRIGGVVIVIGAVVFLLFTQAKTSIALLPVALVMASIVLAVRSTALRVLMVGGIVLLMNLFTVGTVIFTPVQMIVEAVASDPTFTNRTEIWRFGLEEIKSRPLLGAGYQAFWATDSTYHSSSGSQAWIARLANGHNGYFDLALTVGLPALLVALYWLLVEPMKDLAESQRRGASAALDLFYVQIWVFTLLCNCTESLLLSGGGAVWFMLLFALFGMRLQAKARLANGPQSG